MGKFMGRMDAEDLLELLQNKAVDKYFRNLVQSMLVEQGLTKGINKNSVFVTTNSVGQESVELYKLQRNLKALEQENAELRSKLALAYKDKEAYQQERSNWDTWYKDAKDKFEKLAQNKETLENRIAEQEEQLEKLRQQAEREALDSLLAQALALYQHLDELSATAREHVRAICPRESVASFFCGLAQEESLPFLWQEAYNSLIFDNQNDANKLWEMFTLAMNLVNETKNEDRYSYIPEQKGQEYNPQLQVIDRNGPVQGVVEGTLIPGFYNTFSGEVIQRSFVVLR